jgi:hypothetical protein
VPAIPLDRLYYAVFHRVPIELATTDLETEPHCTALFQVRMATFGLLSAFSFQGSGRGGGGLLPSTIPSSQAKQHI